MSQFKKLRVVVKSRFFRRVKGVPHANVYIGTRHGEDTVLLAATDKKGYVNLPKDLLGKKYVIRVRKYDLHDMCLIPFEELAYNFSQVWDDINPYGERPGELLMERDIL